VTRSLASADFCADGVRTSALLGWGREKLEQRFGLANLYAPWMIQSKCGKGLMHTAVLTSPCGSGFDLLI
jgi:hypothetical protein